MVSFFSSFLYKFVYIEILISHRFKLNALDTNITFYGPTKPHTYMDDNCSRHEKQVKSRINNEKHYQEFTDA